MPELSQQADRRGPGEAQSLRLPRTAATINRYPDGKAPLRHRLFAIEYYNPHRKAQHDGRFFKKPDAKDLAQRRRRPSDAGKTRSRASCPSMEILAGDETDRLHRWGYRRYRELFNDRQLLGLERSCQHHRRHQRRARAPCARDQPFRLAALSEHAVPL